MFSFADVKRSLSKLLPCHKKTKKLISMFTPSNLLEEVASSWVPIACVASTSVDFSAFLRHFALWPRQIKASARKGRSGKGERRRGEAKKGNACPKTPRVWKTPLKHSGLGEFIAWQLVNEATNNRSPAVKNLPLSKSKHAPHKSNPWTAETKHSEMWCRGLESWKLNGGASGFVVVISKFGNLSLLGKSVLFLREPFQSVGKKGFLKSNSCWYFQSG